MKAKPECIGGRGYANTARILAILLTILVLGLALFSKAFRFGRDCQRTLGEVLPRHQVNSFFIGFGERGRGEDVKVTRTCMGVPWAV